MNCYEELVDFADKHGLEVIEKHFRSSVKGLCKGNKIGISKAIETTVEKRCVLAEEMAHCLYTVGDILDTRNLAALKQEKIARTAAYEFLLPINKLIDAYFNCSHNLNEIPEYLEVTWEFYYNTIKHYSRKFGGATTHEEYVIYFSPLFVCEVHHINAV